jgi:glycosyltransferase involved in cell wall biosynthesis
MRNSKISLCVISYNQESFIKECLESCLNQTEQPYEIIVSDDHSTDRTWEIIMRTKKRYEKLENFKIYRNEKNLGLASNYTKVARKLSSGDNIIVVGGDDKCKHELIEKSSIYIEKFKDSLVIDNEGIRIDELGVIIDPEREYPNHTKTYSLEDFLMKTKIVSFAPGRITRRTLLEEYGDFHLDCPTEDSTTILRALMMGKFTKTETPLVYYRIHENSVTNNYNKIRKKITERIATQYCIDAIQSFNNGYLNQNYLHKVLFQILIKSRYQPKSDLWSKLKNFLLKKLI